MRPTCPGLLRTVSGSAAAAVLVGACLFVPFQVRHSAPFGFSLTLDAKRGIAVSGGVVTANYPNFDRLDLDLRAYRPRAETYDLTVSVRPNEPNAAPIRTVRLDVPGDRIRDDKAAFADPFVTVRFPPIRDSTGRSYYVWVERGPSHVDDVIVLWSVKSYSTVDGRGVLAALLRDPPGNAAPGLARAVLLALLIGLVASFGWLVGSVTVTILQPGPRVGPRPGPPVARAQG